ncbi:MAG: MBL fold metallo-hydrolase [Desulfomonile tiedjei]|nr:MBL fold metallo-hydrolase [Desulfomonile tiedjei]
MKVTEHLYVYLWGDPKENNCNSVFIDGKVPLLIDPGYLHRVDDLFSRMRADGVNPSKIKVVICTHAHPDHFEGASAFKDGSVKIAISQQEERFIEDVGRPMFAKQGQAMPDYRVDFYVKDGELVLGKLELQVLLTPGHSPGGVSIYWPRHKVLIPGDVVFSQSVGRVDLPGGDIKLLKTSIDRLSKLPVELLIPGHGTAIQSAAMVRKNFDYIKRAFLQVR